MKAISFGVLLALIQVADMVVKAEQEILHQNGDF